MNKKFFVIGSDHQVGATTVIEALLKAGSQRGLKTLALKPIACGADEVDDFKTHPDARRLITASNIDLPYQQINPVLLKADTAPNIAAIQEGKRLSAQMLAGYCRGTFMTASADVILVDAIGGWRTPLNFNETMADLARELKLDVLLVVGMKPGCLNQALLTLDAVEKDGAKVVGWFANCVDPEMSALNESIQTLQRMLRAPLIGVLPFLQDGMEAPETWLNPAFLSD